MFAPNPNDHPHLGALLAKVRPNSNAIPFVALPEVIKDAGVNEFPGQGAGLLGNRYAPFLVESDAATQTFRSSGAALPPDMTFDRLDGRHALLVQLNERSRLPIWPPRSCTCSACRPSWNRTI